MNINEAFPSNYLKAADLMGERTVTITRVQMETLGDDHKPILFFDGSDKGIVLNKTNATNIANAYGPDTDAWGGKSVTLFKAWVDFQGRSVEAIRIRPAAATPDRQQASAGQQFDERNPPPPSDNEYERNFNAG